MENTNLIEKYNYSMELKLKNFEKYVRRQDLSRFIARYELFKLIKNTKGSIIECGVHYGGGLMAWAKICAGFDVFGIDRKVIGFDTFEGFPEISKEDLTSAKHDKLEVGKFSSFSRIEEEIADSIDEFDNNRFLNQFQKVELVKGDATKTIAEYIKNNQHLLVSLLFLDFDLFEPTKKALEIIAPRVVKGGIIAFDELNNESWKGETIATLQYFGSFNNVKIQKFEFDPNISFVVIE